jgi:putative two-component system response regulator
MRRVGELSAALAARRGLPEPEVELIRRAAPLHDVGKIGIPDSVLLKRGSLTRAERERVEAHTLIGARMLAGRGFALLELAKRIALTHHERWDGTGYPHGLAGDDIPLCGRIVALADVFDALTHERPYKPAWTEAEALDEVERQRGRQFDPALVDAFLDVVVAEPALPDLVGGGACSLSEGGGGVPTRALHLAASGRAP